MTDAVRRAVMEDAPKPNYAALFGPATAAPTHEAWALGSTAPLRVAIMADGQDQKTVDAFLHAFEVIARFHNLHVWVYHGLAADDLRLLRSDVVVFLVSGAMVANATYCAIGQQLEDWHATILPIWIESVAGPYWFGRFSRRQIQAGEGQEASIYGFAREIAITARQAREADKNLVQRVGWLSGEDLGKLAILADANTMDLPTASAPQNERAEALVRYSDINGRMHLLRFAYERLMLSKGN